MERPRGLKASSFVDDESASYFEWVLFFFHSASFNLSATSDIRQRGGKNARTRTRSTPFPRVPPFSFDRRLDRRYQVAQSARAKVGGSMLKTWSVAPESRALLREDLSLVWRHSCRAQTRYIARGCPLLDVIGHPLTSTTDGKFIGRWLPVVGHCEWFVKLGNEMSAGSRLNIFITEQ